jgi:NADH-quinone oxidoreductase subunit N
MELSAFIALTPQLILATGIVFALILIAWQRSQQLIALFSQGILLLALVASVASLGNEQTMVTILMKVDDYSRYAFILVLMASLVVTQLSKVMLRRDIEVHDEYYVLLLFVALGAGVLVASDHFASLFLGFELLSIALVGLVGYLRNSTFAVETSFKYLILSATASSFMLLGIAFIYAQTGQLSFSSLANATVLGQSLLYQLGFILFFSGIAFKLSLVPFHFWTPDVYQGSPTPITLLLATVSKIAMFVVLLKCCFNAAQIEVFQQSALSDVIASIAILSMVVGNTLALKQTSIKRLLGYSSIAHMGYLLIVLMVSSTQGINFAWQSVLFYLSAYLLATISLFTVLAIFEADNEPGSDVKVDDWQGMFWHRPMLASLVLIAILSLAGIPLTAGFIGKFYLISFASQQQLWGLLASLIVGSGIALAYYLPIIFKLFSESNKASTPETVAGTNTQAWSTLSFNYLFVTLLIIFGLGLGVFPNSLSQLIALLSIS